MHSNQDTFSIARTIAVCAYCGTTDNIQRDHVIPTSYLREKRKFEGDWLVPACAECNRTLSSFLIFNVPDRAVHVLIRYHIKYRKLLHSILWSDDELIELGYSLRQKIRGAQFERKIVESRMKHLRAIAMMPVGYLSNLRPIIDPDIEDVPEFIDDDIRLAKPRRKIILDRATREDRLSIELRMTLENLLGYEEVSD